jgi:hypothetical protein
MAASGPQGREGVEHWRMGMQYIGAQLTDQLVEASCGHPHLGNETGAFRHYGTVEAQPTDLLYCGGRWALFRRSPFSSFVSLCQSIGLRCQWSSVTQHPPPTEFGHDGIGRRIGVEGGRIDADLGILGCFVG